MKSLFIFLLMISICAKADEISDLEVSPDSNEKIKQIQIKDLSDLQKLTPFKSLSVIQKRYLPKTFRGELNLSISSIINHTFLYFGGLSGRLGFFVREDHGFGLEGFGHFPLLKFVARDLIVRGEEEGKEGEGITPYINVMPQFYAGAYYKWSPIFGKFSVIDKKIIYFDTYMTLGGGVMKVIPNGCLWADQQVKKQGYKGIKDFCPQTIYPDINPTVSLSVGQMFAITQDWAFNWELKGLGIFLRGSDGLIKWPWHIDFSVGMNYYFPGAKYR